MRVADQVVTEAIAFSKAGSAAGLVLLRRKLRRFGQALADIVDVHRGTGRYLVDKRIL